MPQRNIFSENHYYHIYNRGFEKTTLFHEERDFERFVYYLDINKEKKKDSIRILSYVILPNHFHLLVKSNKDSYDLSYVVGNTCASYTRYYKAKYKTPKGKEFFEGRFKSKLIDSEEYLQQCKMYIELNPLKHQLVDRIEDRIWTSYDEKEVGSLNHSVLDFEWEF